MMANRLKNFRRLSSLGAMCLAVGLLLLNFIHTAG